MATIPTQVDYVLALTPAWMGGTLPAHVAKWLTGRGGSAPLKSYN